MEMEIKSEGSWIGADYEMTKEYFAGYAIFAAGLAVGLTNLGSGIAVGVAGSSCAIADAQVRFSPEQSAQPTNHFTWPPTLPTGCVPVRQDSDR